MKDKKIKINFGERYFVEIELSDWSEEEGNYTDITSDFKLPRINRDTKSILNEMKAIEELLLEMAMNGVDIEDEAIVKSIDITIQSYYDYACGYKMCEKEDCGLQYEQENWKESNDQNYF